MTYDGDPKLYTEGDSFDLSIIAGQPSMDEGLENAVSISLFTKDGYWGNAVASSDAEKVGSDFEDALAQPLSNKTRLDVEARAAKALAWMKKVGLADSIVISASIPEIGLMEIEITITQPGGVPLAPLKYSINWATMAARVGV